MKNTEKLCRYMFLLYVIVTLIIPVAFLNKVIFGGIILLFIIAGQRVWRVINAPFIIGFIFLYGFIISQLTYSDQALAISFLFSVTGLLIIYPLTIINVDIDEAVNIGGKILITTDMLLVVYEANKYMMQLPYGINNLYAVVQKIIPSSFLALIEQYGEVAIGERGFGENLYIMIHVGTIPFVYLPICLWYRDFLREGKKKNLFWVLIGVCTVVFSTSRALLLLLGVIIFFLTIKESKSFEVKLVILYLGIFVSLSILFYLIQKTTVFSVSELSNSIKIGHIQSAFKSMGLMQILGGNGLASYYYSSGVNGFLAHTEITLLDYYRYFGVLGGSIIYIKLLLPLKFGQNLAMIRKNNCFTEMVIFIGYLIMSLTNPVLMNSMGIIVILWYWKQVIPKNYYGE